MEKKDMLLEKKDEMPAGNITAKPESEKPSERSPIFVETERMFEKFAELSRETALRAYEYFMKRGGEFGREVDDWFRAESEILRPVPVEITEQNGELNVLAAVPGFKPEEIGISVKDNLLIINGHTEKSTDEKLGNVVFSDFESDRFFRQLSLPNEVDADHVRAELKDGFLRITLPKVAQPEPKQIAVTAG